jgi:hypothetical protein
LRLVQRSILLLLKLELSFIYILDDGSDEERSGFLGFWFLEKRGQAKDVVEPALLNIRSSIKLCVFCWLFFVFYGEAVDQSGKAIFFFHLSVFVCL